MNAIQMFAVQIVVAVLFKIHQSASVCLNMKVIHRMCHVNHQKMLAQYQLVDQILNAHVSPMELQNAHAYPVLSKVQTQFVAVLNQRAPVNHSHVDTVLHVMSHEVQFVIVQKEQLEIHSSNVHHQLSLKSFVNQDHVVVSYHIIFHYTQIPKIRKLCTKIMRRLKNVSE